MAFLFVILYLLPEYFFLILSTGVTVTQEGPLTSYLSLISPLTSIYLRGTLTYFCPTAVNPNKKVIYIKAAGTFAVNIFKVCQKRPHMKYSFARVMDIV